MFFFWHILIVRFEKDKVPGLHIGFLLLRYSVLFTIESCLCFISVLYLDLYVLGDDASISYGSSMQT